MASSNPYASHADPGRDHKLEERLPGDFDFSKHGRPTNVRFGVLGITALMSILLYLDRYAISVATPVMLVELDITKQQMGYAMSAFFWAYALMQVPSGWLSDTLGGRLTLTIYIVFWSLAIGAMGLVFSLTSLIALRLLLGIGQAGAYPTAAGILKNWIPVTRRGTANSVVIIGGRSGGLLSNVVTPPLMALVGLLFGVTTGQWRLVFAFYGLLGFVWAISFYFWFRNTPREHPACNESERAFIEHGRPPQPVATAKPTFDESLADYLQMLARPNLWVLSLINFLINIGWIFLVTWMPTYLNEVYGLELWLAGTLTACAGVAGLLGNVCGGFATDTLVQRVGLTWGRRLPGIVASGGAAVLYGICWIIDQAGAGSAFQVVAIFAGAYFLIDLGLSSIWATYQDIGGKRVATLLGFANMCGNIGAAIFASVIGYLADHDKWQFVFFISCGSLVLTALLWLLVNPRVHMSSRDTI